MPMLDLRDWPQDTPRSGYRTLATMIYPNDEHRRQELYNMLSTEDVLWRADTPGVWTNLPNGGELLCLLKARHQGPSNTEIRQAALHAYIRGCTAGEILFLIHWLNELGHLNGVAKGGVGKVCHMLVHLAKQNHNISSLTLLKLPCMTAKALRDNVWSPYKSVVHLWAAHILLIKGHMTISAQELHIPHEQWFVVPAAFLSFLELAEYFRQFGEGHIPHAQSLPLLLPEDTWCVPPSLPCANPKQGPMPPLPEHYRQALETYRAKNIR
jgi:hypothetical protein